MSQPIIIVHRRNLTEQLTGLPAACWVEVDVDFHDGQPVLSHDPVGPQGAELLDVYILRAILRGIAGFVFDCKREGIETVIKPLLAAHNVANYFFLNEMEIQGDMFLERETGHRSAIRIWKYHGAAGLIRYANDMKSARQNYPSWAWIDCWQRGLPTDIKKAFVPVSKADVSGLKDVGISLCLCSPELYAHDYDKTYDKAELQALYRGILQYRKTLADGGIAIDAVCTKFPKLWSEELDSLNRSSEIEL